MSIDSATALQILGIAEKHAATRQVDSIGYSSARLCMDDATSFLQVNHPYWAARRALRAISYLVGVYHPDYQEAKARIDASA